MHVCLSAAVDTTYKPNLPPGPAEPARPEDRQPVDARPPGAGEDPSGHDVTPEKPEKPSRPEDGSAEHGKPHDGSDVFIMENNDERATSFFAQPGILAG